MIILFLKGLVFGFSVAMPVGPMGIICLKRTLRLGFIYGLLTGLGAATADLTYGIITVLGITGITDFLLSFQVWFRLGGIVLLLWMGIKALKTPVQIQEKETNLSGTWGSAYLLTLSNPLTIILFTAIILNFKQSLETSTTTAMLLLVGGIFSGSLLWWLILSTLTHFIRKKIFKYMNIINKAGGIILIIYGLYFLLSIFLKT